MVETKTFDDHLLAVVDRFLQTVVVVDDQALGPKPPPADSDEEEGESRVAGQGRGVRGDLNVPEAQAADEHDLDAKMVTDAFARRGLICGLLSPDPGEEIGDELVKAARRADVVVLDWVMDRDEGRKALELFRRILESDSLPSNGRLRAIAIYTGQRGLRAVASRLKETLNSYYLSDRLAVDDGGLTLTKGPVRVAVFAKERVSGLPTELQDRRVRFDELPDRVRREFAALTRGIVTAVALDALSALREDTHRVLSVLSPDLDVAYLGHRSVLPEPEDAQSQVVALVASELRAVIEDHTVGDVASEAVLLSWVDSSCGDGSKLGALIDPPNVISRAQVDGMLHFGLASSETQRVVGDLGTASKTHLTKNVKPAATRVFASTVEEADESDAELANRMMLRTIYSNPPRLLHLGTVVQAPDRTYWVCVQPVCDSVRLKLEVRAFPFLRLKESDKTKFQFVVTEPRGRKRFLFLQKDPRHLVMARFKPRAGQSVIQAADVGGGYAFRDTSQKVYRWAAQLKTEFAQKVAVDLANELGQVAVDEAELRRLSVSS